MKEIDKPVPADNEVLARVYAAAVNAADWHLMRGDPYVARLSIGLRAPKAKIRGRDFAGRVEVVGKDVTRFHPGEEVFGDLGDACGAFGEYVHVAENLVESKPAKLTFEQAAAIPLAGRADEAIAILRPLAEAGNEFAAKRLAELLGKQK